MNTLTYQAAIYDWALQPRQYTQMMTPQPAPVYTVPGLKVGCLPYDAMIASTLECFFSEECINNTVHWISNLSPSEWPKPLNSSAHQSFRPTDTLLQILDQKMVDAWETAQSFDTYYAACAPVQCSYTFQTSKGFLYLITTLMGLYGGMIVAMRTVVSVLVPLARRIWEKFVQTMKQNDTSVAAERGTDTWNPLFVLTSRMVHFSFFSAPQCFESSVEIENHAAPGIRDLPQIQCCLL